MPQKKRTPKDQTEVTPTSAKRSKRGVAANEQQLPLTPAEAAQPEVSANQEPLPAILAPAEPPPYEAVVRERLNREHCREGEVQATLIWNDPADLDLHAYCACGAHIFFGNRECVCGGWLDRDMNRSTSSLDYSLAPVENIFWAASPSGQYKITVHNFNNRTMPDSVFTNANRRVPYRVRIRRGGDMAGQEQWFEGSVGPRETVEVYSWGNKGLGAFGRMVVLNPLPNGGTFAEMCAAQDVTYQKGQGYYALVRKSEKVSAKKDMMLHNKTSDTFTIGSAAVKAALGLKDGDITITPTEVPDHCTLYNQSTSHNRKLPESVHALMMVPTVQEALRHRRR
ncbi:hypothetical protein BDR26DRAFT_852288 [Obelidium mucronatum]|nr:hypothetical protein BDR26DRAFT_852288 [Obelidium mucronatum]